MTLEFSNTIFSSGLGIGLIAWALSSGLSYSWALVRFFVNP